MQKIVIDNFGPISHVEITIPPLLVLIGEQASGKSTIAKLIYFFKSLSDEFFTRYLWLGDNETDYKNHILFSIREKFYDMFGSTFHLPDFNITFYYNSQKSISLSLNSEKKVEAHVSDGFFCPNDRNMLNKYKKEYISFDQKSSTAQSTAEKAEYEHKKTSFLRQIADKVNEIFENRHNDSLYIIAGRNAMVGYSDTFEKMLSIHIQKEIENKGKRAYEAKDQTIDETLMLAFMDRVNKLKQTFIKKGDFEGLISQSEKNHQEELIIANALVNKIIKGKYSSSSFGEQIIVDENKYVSLKDASSGQQEAIRILQDAYYSIYSNNNVFRIIEEPEAHLYPESQMYLLQLLAMMLNHNESNQLIITTHSPYILTSINNLIYAYQVGQTDKNKVTKIIEGKSWISVDRVKSYMLSNGVAEDILTLNST